VLSPNDVINLEHRWSKWRQKRMLKGLGYGSLAIILSFACWYGYSNFSQSVLDDTHIVNKTLQEPIEINPNNVENIPQNIQNLNQVAKVDKNSSFELRQKPRLALTIQPIPRSSQPPKIPLPKNETIALDKDQVSAIPPQKNIDKTKNVASIAQNNIVEEEVVQKTEIKRENRIQINMEPSSADTTQYLKEKFYATGNIVFALMVSEEYYHMGQYNDSIRWALTANELDPKNEHSWILFAQSKAKLGRPQEAIMALEEFLKTNNSGKIESLLVKLKRGTL